MPTDRPDLNVDHATGRTPPSADQARRGRQFNTNAILASRHSEAPIGSFANRVARSIGMDVLTGRLPAGQKLPAEAELLQRYGISRTVLREALKTLTAKGLLMARTRVGTVVRDRQHWNFFDADVLAWKIDVGLDMELLRVLREARLAVEPFAARLAAERSSPEQVAEMRESVCQMREAVGDRPSFAQADLRFHRAVAAASDNFLLSSFGTVIETALVCATLLLPLERRELHEEAVVLHEQLAEAIADRQTDLAVRLMSEMIGFGAAVGEDPTKAMAGSDQPIPAYQGHIGSVEHKSAKGQTRPERKVANAGDISPEGAIKPMWQVGQGA